MSDDEAALLRELVESHRDFVDETRRADVAGTLRHVVDEIAAQKSESRERHANVMRKLESHDYRISTLEQGRAVHSLRVRTLEGQAEKLEERVEVTGSYHVNELQQKNGWWRDNAVKVVVALAGAIGGVLGAWMLDALAKRK